MIPKSSPASGAPAELARQGQVNMHGRPYAAESIKAMVRQRRWAYPLNMAATRKGEGTFL
jgi:hypothetical protein